jgi:hypothetical protein
MVYCIYAIICMGYLIEEDSKVTVLMCMGSAAPEITRSLII